MKPMRGLGFRIVVRPGKVALAGAVRIAPIKRAWRR
jgi:hypothetical protein